MAETPPQHSGARKDENSSSPSLNIFAQPPGEAPPADPLVATAMPVNFCAMCGAAWQLDWLSCAICAARTSAAPEQYQRRKAGRSIGSAIGLYFSFLVGIIPCGVISTFAIEDNNQAEIIGDFASDIFGTLLVLVWVVASWKNVRSALSTVAPLKWCIAAVLVGGLTFVLATAAIAGLHYISGIREIHYSDHFISAGYGWGIIVLLIAIQPAIIEELAFRGVIFGALRYALDDREVILVSSLMFMVIHLSVPSFPHLLIIGLALGYLRSKTGSLYPCMLLHFTHNALVIASEAYRYH